jgi:integral membrane protein
MTTAIRSLNRLRVVGVLEGVSYLVLLGVAMPLKYFAGQPEAVTVIGWLHGALFVAFVAALTHTMLVRRWPMSRTAGAFIASLVPFGTFVLDRRLRTEIESLADAGVGV